MRTESPTVVERVMRMLSTCSSESSCTRSLARPSSPAMSEKVLEVLAAILSAATHSSFSAMLEALRCSVRLLASTANDSFFLALSVA